MDPYYSHAKVQPTGETRHEGPPWARRFVLQYAIALVPTPGPAHLPPRLIAFADVWAAGRGEATELAQQWLDRCNAKRRAAGERHAAAWTVRATPVVEARNRGTADPDVDDGALD